MVLTCEMLLYYVINGELRMNKLSATHCWPDVTFGGGVSFNQLVQKVSESFVQSTYTGGAFPSIL